MISLRRAAAICVTTLGMFAALPGMAAALELSGRMEQGGLVIVRAEPGARATLDNTQLDANADGIFAIGFDRDHAAKAKLRVTYADGRVEERELAIAPRDWKIQRIEGIPQKYVSPPAEELARIARDRDIKTAARATRDSGTGFAESFIWPTTGPISGVFGSQRYYNSEARRPHYGVDVAAPTGTPILAPASGIVTLADPDMYFEGGLIFLDHGQGLTSLMMHMSRIDVKTGDRVSQGDVLGAVGGTGRATGPHLHWGLYWRGAYLDAQKLVPPMDEARAAEKAKAGKSGN